MSGPSRWLSGSSGSRTIVDEKSRRWLIALALTALACRSDAPPATTGSAGSAIATTTAPLDAVVVDAATPYVRSQLARGFECLATATLEQGAAEGWRAAALREGMRMWTRGELPGKPVGMLALRLANGVMNAPPALRDSTLVLSQSAIALAETGHLLAAKVLADRALTIPSVSNTEFDLWKRDALAVLAWAGEADRALAIAKQHAGARAAIAVGLARAGQLDRARAVLAKLPAKRPAAYELVEAYAWLGELADMDRELARLSAYERADIEPTALDILARTRHPQAAARLDAAIAKLAATTQRDTDFSDLDTWSKLVASRDRSGPSDARRAYQTWLLEPANHFMIGADDPARAHRVGLPDDATRLFAAATGSTRIEAELALAIARHEFARAIELVPAVRAGRKLAEATTHVEPLELELWIELAEAVTDETIDERFAALVCR